MSVHLNNHYLSFYKSSLAHTAHQPEPSIHSSISSFKFNYQLLLIINMNDFIEVLSIIILI